MRLLPLLLALLPAVVQAEEYRASVSVALDVSSGMQMPADKAFFAHTLATVRQAMEKHAPVREGLEASLRLFGGGNEHGDACEASEMVVPPGVSPGPVLQALAPKLKAKGARPLATALEGAVNDLSRAPGTMRGVILVTSGDDGCGRDVCQVARDLRSDPGLGNVRVLLVGGGDAEAKRLRCLGQVTQVRDQAQLSEALAHALDAAFEPAALTVTAQEKGVDVAAEVELFAADDEQPLLRAKAGKRLLLAGGLYQVRVVRQTKDGSVREGWRREVELSAGSQVALKVAVGSEPATLVVHVRFNGREAPEGTRLFVFPPGETERELADGWPDAPLRLNPGRYDVRAEIPGLLGPVEVWRPDVRLEGGVAREVTLDAVQPQGSLRVDLTSGGARVDEAMVTLVPNGSQSVGHVGLPVFEDTPVPAGIYAVVAHLDTPAGPLHAVRSDVKVAPDQASYIRMDLGPSGQLTVEIAGYTEDDSFRVGVSRAGAGEPSGWFDAWAPIRLPAGKYDLVVEDLSGHGKKLLVRRGVAVSAGDSRVVRIEP